MEKHYKPVAYCMNDIVLWEISFFVCPIWDLQMPGVFGNWLNSANFQLHGKHMKIQLEEHSLLLIEKTGWK